MKEEEKPKDECAYCYKAIKIQPMIVSDQAYHATCYEQIAKLTYEKSVKLMKDKETETGTIQCWICPVCFDDHGEREGLCKSEDVAKIISELKAENERLKASSSMQEVEKVQTLFKESVDKLLRMFERDVQTEHQQSEECIKKEGHHMGTARWHRAYGQAMQDAWARTKSVLLGDHSGSIKPIEIIEGYQKSLAGKGE